MDNQNDPNSPNNSTPIPSGPVPPNPFGAPPPAPNPTPAPFPQPTPLPTAEPGSVLPQQPPNLSSLDNPWGAPLQAPSIDGLPQNPGTTTSQPLPSSPDPMGAQSGPIQPTWVPPVTPPSEQLAPTNIPTAYPEPVIQSEPAPTETGSLQPESAPTDLSHLISNNGSLETPSSQVTPESLVVPSSSGAPPEVSVPTEPKKGIPKWVIGIGIGLILVVAATSAYFILGIGQSPKATTSLPATIIPKTETVATPLPVVTPEPTTQSASGSANFGQLQGSSPAATSAAELLRQRQQGH